MASKHGYLKEVDALRGIAVLGVLLFHAYPAAFPLGFLGVDIFFVISGFVIGRTYLRPLADRTVTWRTFWLKRFRRLVPAYIVCILATAPIAAAVLDPHLAASFGRSLLAQPFYLQNFLFWVEGDYFNDALTKPLLHTWSLAVEEQFYLLFLLPVLVARAVGTRTVYVVLLFAAILLSYAAMAVIGNISPKTAFYLLPFRAWQFLAGIGASVVARLLLDRQRSYRGTRPLAAAVTVALAVLVMRPGASSDATASYMALVTAATAVLVLLHDLAGADAVRRTASGGSAIGGLLTAALGATGRMSYSLYLWHWPIIAILAVYLGRHPDPIEATACLGVAFALGALSWRYVEQPARSPARSRGFPVVRSGIAGYALALLIGIVLVGTRGALFRFPEPERTWLAVSQEKSPYRCGYLKRILDMRAEFCPINEVAGGPGLLIVGDSHADQLDEMVARLGEEHGVRVYLATRNCDLDLYLTKAYCGDAVVRKMLADIEALDIGTVLAISSWAGELQDASDFERGAGLFIERGARVLVARTTPVGEWFDPRRRAELSLAGEPPPAAYDRPALERQNAALDDALKRLSRRYPSSVDIVDATATICPPGADSCDWLEGVSPLAFDDNHLSRFGVARVEDVYRKAFVGIVGEAADARAPDTD